MQGEKVGERSEKGRRKGWEKRLGERLGEKLGERLTENQLKIIKEISKDVYITANDLSKIVGISSRKIEKNISVLKAKQYIKRVGPDKGGHWKLIR